jgi:hypothetical protein
MPLRGLYAYMADATSFNECRTGKRYPVSQEAAHIDMEQAYLAFMQDNPGAPLLATLEGRFEERTTDPGAGPREHLVVEHFERFWPEETCTREALAQASLLNTYWRAVEIYDEPVILEPEQQEPHFVLASEGNRVGVPPVVTESWAASNRTQTAFASTVLVCLRRPERHQPRPAPSRDCPPVPSGKDLPPSSC